jgi:hypothetical protein
MEPVALFGPFSGKLSNEGGRLALEKPLAPDLPGEGVSWVIVDEVIYSEDTPWMPSADGSGHSLQRALVNGAGVDPGSWVAAAPTPDGAIVVTPDLRLLLAHAGGTLFSFNFELVPGNDYTLQMRTNLVSGDWTMLTNVAYPATQYDHLFPTELGQAFFRLRQNP